MSHGPISVFTKTMASAGTLTGQFDLGRAWKSTYLEIPTMTSNTQLHIQVSDNDTTGPFRRTYHPMINSSTVGTNVFAIASNVTNAAIPIPNGFQFMKVESTATVDNGCVFKIICSD